MALTPEQKQKISDFVRQRIREGKPPLTPAARKVWDKMQQKKQERANKLQQRTV